MCYKRLTNLYGVWANNSKIPPKIQKQGRFKAEKLGILFERSVIKTYIKTNIRLSILSNMSILSNLSNLSNLFNLSNLSI